MLVKDRIFNLGFMFDLNQHHFPYVKQFTADKNSFLLDFLAKNKYDMVLDFGCATGLTSWMVSDDKYIGVDVNESYLRRAHRKYPDKFFFFMKNILPLGRYPFKWDVFDIIICSFVLHHIPDKILKATKLWFHKILSKGGKILVLEAAPKEEQPHRAVRIIMANDIGDNHKDVWGWRDFFSDIFYVKNRRVKFGEYHVNALELKR